MKQNQNRKSNKTASLSHIHLIPQPIWNPVKASSAASNKRTRIMLSKFATTITTQWILYNDNKILNKNRIKIYQPPLLIPFVLEVDWGSGELAHHHHRSLYMHTIGQHACIESLLYDWENVTYQSAKSTKQPSNTHSFNCVVLVEMASLPIIQQG